VNYVGPRRLAIIENDPFAARRRARLFVQCLNQRSSVDRPGLGMVGLDVLRLLARRVPRPRLKDVPTVGTLGVASEDEIPPDRVLPLYVVQSKDDNLRSAGRFLPRSTDNDSPALCAYNIAIKHLSVSWLPACYAML